MEMHTQLEIDIEAVMRCRADDPGSSVSAAEGAAKFATGHAGRILQALKSHGAQSAHELSLLIGLTVVQVDRRLPELRRAKQAEVVTLDDGADLIRGGCRVWRARKAV